MTGDARCTNFNIKHTDHHATCIEIDIACKNFSTTHATDDTMVPSPCHWTRYTCTLKLAFNI